MSQANLDFETYSEASIKLGPHAYAQDSSTDILCFAYKLPSENDVRLWSTHMPRPNLLLRHIKEGGLIRAWNAEFEYAIYYHICFKRWGWPPLKITQLRDTQADAHTLSLPSSLKKCGEALKLEGKFKKLDEGKRLINILCKPRKATRNKPYTRVTKDIDPESFEMLYKYCRRDVIAENKIHEFLNFKMSKKELKLYHLTVRMNQRGIPFNHKLVKFLIKKRDKFEIKLLERVNYITQGDLENTRSPMKIKLWLAKMGLPMKNLTKDCVTSILEALQVNTIKDKRVRDFLKIRQKLSLTSIKKLDFIELAIHDGRVRNNLIYHRATTGRFAGSGVQIQNFPKAKINYKEAIEELKSNSKANVFKISSQLLRHTVQAPKDKIFFISDFSSIEAIVILWASGATRMLKKVEKGEDIYIDMASKILKKSLDKVSKQDRDLGKIFFLAWIYGAGINTLQNSALNLGYDFSLQRVKSIKKLYGKMIPKISSFWKGNFVNAVAAIRKPNTTFKFKSFFYRYDSNNCFLQVKLPSSRKLYFPKAKLAVVDTPWHTQQLVIQHEGLSLYNWTVVDLRDTKLAQNLIQAVARDILCDAMLRLEQNNYKLVATIHDEIVSCDAESFGDLNEFQNIMNEVPDWARGMIIKTEGRVSKTLGVAE